MAREPAAVQKPELTKTAIPERSAIRTYPYISVRLCVMLEKS